MAASPRGSFPTFPEASLIRPPAVPAEQVAAHPPAAPWRRGGAHAAVPRPPGAATSPSLAAGCLPRASSAWRRSGHVAAARRCVLIADGISAAARHTIRRYGRQLRWRACVRAQRRRPVDHRALAGSACSLAAGKLRRNCGEDGVVDGWMAWGRRRFDGCEREWMEESTTTVNSAHAVFLGRIGRLPDRHYVSCHAQDPPRRSCLYCPCR